MCVADHLAFQSKRQKSPDRETASHRKKELAPAEDDDDAEDHTLYCLCKREFDGDEDMIQCDGWVALPLSPAAEVLTI